MKGSIEKVYLSVNGSMGPDRNVDNSYLTMISFDGLLFGIINIVGNFGTVFVDQSFWQCGLAASPRNGVWGFIFGGLTWFGVPFTFATTMGLAYLALGAQQGHPLLDSSSVDQGMVAPIVAELMMGSRGQMMVVLMIVMAVTSTGSAEVIAVTSILVYDIYQIYLKPFRMVFDASTCILCGRERGHMANIRDQCHCISMTYCKNCISDNETRGRTNWKRAVKPAYTCTVHGTFRTYNEFLHRLKNWCQISATMTIIPLTLLLNALAISLNWVYLFMGVLVGSAVIPIVLALTWSRLSGPGMVAGAIGGAFLGLLVWLIVASQEPHGLHYFIQSTGAQRSMLAGNLVSLLGGGLITVVVSVITNRECDGSQLLRTWERTRDIDNPLRPWTEVYAKEMGLKRFNVLGNRPSLEDTEKRYRLDKILAIVFGSVLTISMLILWPLATVSAGVMDFTSFTHWIRLMTVYGFLATILIIIVPVVTEIYEIKKYLSEKNSVRDEDIDVKDYQQATGGEGAPPGSNGATNNSVNNSRRCSGDRKIRNSEKFLALEDAGETKS